MGGFYLFSEDREGQRRGREVLAAFLGPGVSSFESVPDEVLTASLSEQWRSTGLVYASFVRRHSDPETMLHRLEDAVATLRGRSQSVAELRPTHVDLLRDLRLAMLAKEADLAARMLDELRLSGHLSAENLRFLTIEFLASFGRWTELVSFRTSRQ